MAILNNGLQTMELGATAWRVIINDNFTKIYTKQEVDAKLTNGETAFKARSLSVAKVEFSGALHTTANTERISGFMEIKVNGAIKKIPYYD